MKKGKKSSKKRHAGKRSGVTVVAVNPSTPRRHKRKAHKKNPGKRKAHKRHASASRVVVVNPTRRTRRRHTRSNPGVMGEHAMAALGGIAQGVADYGIDQINTSPTVQTLASVAAGAAIGTAAHLAKQPAMSHGATGATARSLFDRVRLMLATKGSSSNANTTKTAAGASNVLNQAGTQAGTGTGTGMQGIPLRALPAGAPRMAAVARPAAARRGAF